MRGLFRWASPALIAVGAAVLAAPAQAAPERHIPVQAPTNVCPAHPAQLAGRHVRVQRGDREALLCANLRGAVLDDLQLIQFDMRYTDLTNASLAHASLIQADLTGAKLGGAKFDDADLTQATLDNVDATGASFRDAKLGQATIHSATLVGVNLTGADLIQADLTGSDLSGATLDGSDFGQATMTGVRHSGTHGRPSNGDGSGVLLSASEFGVPVLAISVAALVCVLLAVGLVTWAVRRATRRSYGYAMPYPTAGPNPFTSPPPAVPNPYRAASSTAAQGATSAPYVPTVPDIPVWQPASTAASMEEAQHVIEDVGSKRWFGKR